MSVRFEVKEGSTATIDGPATLRVIGGSYEIDGVEAEFPRTLVLEGETATVTGPAIMTVRSDVAGIVLIDGEPVDPGTLPPDVAPVISAVAPNTAVCGDPTDIVMVITGDGFMPNSIIMFAGLDEPTVTVSDTELSTIVKPSLFVGPDDIAVNVRNGSAISNELTFTFTATQTRSKTGAKNAEAKAQGKESD